ncbi:hypothetical protein MMC34_008361 [Xylographa carneopallida]|nr:hypothetical protein [Xylographa carneopallida]
MASTTRAVSASTLARDGRRGVVGEDAGPEGEEEDGEEEGEVLAAWRFDRCSKRESASDAPAGRGREPTETARRRTDMAANEQSAAEVRSRCRAGQQQQQQQQQQQRSTSRAEQRAS